MPKRTIGQGAELPEWMDLNNPSRPIKYCPNCGHDEMVMQENLAWQILIGKAKEGDPALLFHLLQPVIQPKQGIIQMGPVEIPAVAVMFDICASCRHIIVFDCPNASAVMVPQGPPPGAPQQKFPFKGN